MFVFPSSFVIAFVLFRAMHLPCDDILHRRAHLRAPPLLTHFLLCLWSSRRASFIDPLPPPSSVSSPAVRASFIDSLPRPLTNLNNLISFKF
ncbi:uncharacterized protein DS421_10g296410 [Arachis hypogaea]|nr:uncharacterized protein DS421_10g296410 [Arachis hypogaea]